MSPREKPKDPNDPRNYLPIPHGGPILLGQAIIVAILTALCVGIAIAGGFLHARIDDSVIKFFAKILLVVGAGGAVSILALGYRWMWRDASEYWLRNVRGYRLACWMGAGPSGRRDLVCHAVIEPGDSPKSHLISSAMLVLPLGGWFRTPTVVMPEGQSLGWKLKRGQLRLRYGLLRLGSYPKELPYGAIAGHLIQLRDRHGDRMTMSVANALEIFDQHTLCVCTDQGSGLRGVVEGYQRATEAMQRERDHEQEAHRNARFMWTSALIAMEQTIHEIAKTSRFVGSIEALRIRLFLLERFRGLVPTPDPKEPQRAKWIGWADEEIASARADLARRDRHKRKPSASAGA